MRRCEVTDPFCDLTKFWDDRGRWPASWVSHPEADGTASIVMAFRRNWILQTAQTIRFHVSADQRYELWLNGARIGRGPERGDRLNWYFKTHEITLQSGAHQLVARVWWLRDDEAPPLAQISVKPAFLLAAEGDAGAILSTGVAPWRVKRINGCKFIPPAMAWGTGSKLHIVGSHFDWDWETGAGDGWVEPRTVHAAFGPEHLIDQPMLWQLKPGPLPAMLERSINVGVARHVQALDDAPSHRLSSPQSIVRSVDHLETEARLWDSLLAGKSTLVLPSHTRRRVIVDLQNYYCAFIDCVTSGGAGSVVQVWWAESLYEVDESPEQIPPKSKGNRDAIEGKIFVGIGDTFEPEGGDQRLFSTLWWEAGRYLQLTVTTADDPLQIDSLTLRETHYPYVWNGDFHSNDRRLLDIIPLAKRTMEMCTHETFMDCPYYEQLMYVGDTRLEILTAYTWCSDDRMARKALILFNESRKLPGFTQSRYPSRSQQTIPPFSAWWIAMLHDFMMWRGDRSFVADLLPGVRSVLDAFEKYKGADGLILGPPGWNFLDWVPTWTNGMPEGADYGISAALNLQLAWVYKQAAELEEFVGHTEMARLHIQRSVDLARACNTSFWCEKRGLYADDDQHRGFSEHTQCLAILADIVPHANVERVVAGLMQDGDLARTTIYFSHYLFEVFGRLGRIDRLIERLNLWFGLRANGLYTTVEAPEPSRSDCHAWAAHPLYHYTATILGIRPGCPGFETVRITPRLGPLRQARGSFEHDRGTITIDLEIVDDKLRGWIELPEGLPGELVIDGESTQIRSGRNQL